jgi:hypothetical protein
MRSVAALSLAVLLACAPAEEAPPAGPTLADFAGTWQNVTVLEGVVEPVASTLRGSAAGHDWVMELEGRDPVPVQVSVMGDSLITQSVEYESILRPGVMVSVRTAGVLHNGMLMGTLVATYRTPEGDQVVTGTMTGTRVE